MYACMYIYIYIYTHCLNWLSGAPNQYSHERVYVQYVRGLMSCVICHASCVICHASYVLCHVGGALFCL